MWINEYLDRQEVVQAMAESKTDWEEAAIGQSFVCTDGSIGLLLADFVMAVRFTPDGQVLALGEGLVNELQDILVSEQGSGVHL